MQKVLIVTYYWPPAGGPGVQRWLYFAAYLREFGIEPVIYTPENPHYPLRDDSLVHQLPKGIKVYRQKIREPYQFARLLSRSGTKRISSGIINREKPGRIERLMLWVRGNIFIPDARKYWIKPSVHFLSGVMIKEGIDTLITTGPPHSMHLIGLKLKGLHKIRWIADFRDPWTSIGYHNALRLSRRALEKHRKLEAAVLNGADALITTSTQTMREFKLLTPRPIHVITNGYSGEPNSKRQPEGPFTISHIGSLLSGRNPVSLWNALKNLSDEYPAFKRDLKIELIGPVSPEVLKSIRDHGLAPQLSVKDYIPHDQALEHQRRAQILLLIEIDIPETRGIIPGKFFEYLAASRPILALGPENWEVASLIAQCKSGAAFRYEEQKEITRTLLSWYQDYKKHNLTVAAEGVEAYHRRALTGRLVKEILWE
ncbi:glycosyltransferase family 4 protein [Robiginitalea sp.]|uniref:glycosyltransferase family 4 protein n=1 Tax=Robiginitalea sp. TaxID=1902411 RepID=UPI003C71603A